MVSRFAPLAVLSLAVASVFAQSDIRIETPLNVVVCRPVQFTFTGGTPPYFLSAHPAGQPAAPATVDFNTVESSPFRWTANLAVGTSLFLRLRDSNGEVAESGTFSVLDGPDTSCVGQNPDQSSASDAPAPSASGSSSSGSAASSAPVTSAPASSTRAPSSITRSVTGSGSISSTRPTQSGSAGDEDGAALSNYVSTGAVGLAAIAGAAILL